MRRTGAIHPINHNQVAERQFWFDPKKKKMQANTLICCLTCGYSFVIWDESPSEGFEDYFNRQNHK